MAGEGRSLRAGDELIRSRPSGLWARSREVEWLDKTLAKTDVDEVRPIECDFECEVVDDLIRATEEHRRAEKPHVEPKRVEECGEGTIHLETPTSAATIDDLVERPAKVCPNLPASRHVEVLKRNGRHVGQLKSREGAKVDGNCVIEADPSKICIDIEWRNVSAHVENVTVPLMSDTDWSNPMAKALIEAKAALDHEDVPVGAVVLDSAGHVVAARHNERELTGDPTAHAEVLALRDAAEQAGTWRLDGHTLVVTLEPCVMCAGAAQQARVDRVVFGAMDLNGGALGSLYNVGDDPRFAHEFDVVMRVEESRCAELLTEFFASRR